MMDGAADQVRAQRTFCRFNTAAFLQLLSDLVRGLEHVAVPVAPRLDDRLQQLERNPPPPVVTEPADALSAVRGAMLFTAVVPEIKTRAALLAQSLGHLQALRASIASEQAALKADNDRLEAERREIAVLRRA